MLTQILEIYWREFILHAVHLHQNEWIILSVRAGHEIDKILSTTVAVQFQGKIGAAGASNYNSQ